MTVATQARWASREELERWTEQAPLFSNRKWLTCVERGLSLEPRGVVTELDGRPAQLSVYFLARRGIFRLAGNPLRGSMTPYQRPIRLAGDAVPLEDDVEAQLRFFRAEGFDWVEWGRDHSPRTGFPSSSRPIERQTFRLDLSAGAEKVWAGFEKQARNMVRKGEKAGAVVEICEGTPEQLDWFYRSLTATFARSGRRPPHPKSFYEICAFQLIPEGRLWLLAAKAEGKTLAMGWFPHDAHEMHYMSGTSDPDSARFAPNNLIQWSAIRLAAESRIPLYDLGGRGIASIDRFKASFGGYVHAHRWAAWGSPTARLAEGAYGLISPMTERLKVLIGGARC